MQQHNTQRTAGQPGDDAGKKSAGGHATNKDNPRDQTPNGQRPRPDDSTGKVPDVHAGQASGHDGGAQKQQYQGGDRNREQPTHERGRDQHNDNAGKDMRRDNSSVNPQSRGADRDQGRK